MKTHEIDELDRDGVVFIPTGQERRTLRRQMDSLSVEWRADGAVRVRPRGQVGVAQLSGDTAIRVTTKVPISNVLQLASLAYRTMPLADPVGAGMVASESQPHEWLAVLLVNEVEALSGVGLRAGYVVAIEDLPYVRGRLRFDAGTPNVKPGLTSCEFTDFVTDTPENRALRSALELLTQQRLLPGLHSRIRRLLPRFAPVTWVRPSRHLLHSCRITRLNRHYSGALALTRLLFGQAGVELDSRGIRAPAHFFPMETVFEKAVTNYISRRLPDVRAQTGRSYQPISGQPDQSVSYRADILLGRPPRVVVDTKYARPEEPNRYGGTSFRNDNLYQAVFYGLSLGCPTVLVYPKVDRDIDVTYRIGGVQLTLLSVDLQLRGLQALDRLAERLVAISEPASAG